MSDLARVAPEGHSGSGASGGSRRRFWIAAALVAVLYAASVNNPWAIRPDSATYLAVGRSLADGHGLTYNGGPAWALPPLIPLLAAACRLLVGPDDYWLINAVMRLFAVGAILASYALARRLGGGLPDRVREDLAVGVLLLVGTSARFFGNSMPVLTDVPFTFWFVLGLYGFVRGRSGHWGWTLAGSLVMVVAVATRYVGIVIFAGMVLAVLVDFRRPGYAKRALAALAGPAVMAAGGALALCAGRGPKSLTDLVPALVSGPREHWNYIIRGVKARDLAVGLASLPKAVTETLIDQDPWWFSLVPATLVAVGFIVAVRRRERLVWVPAVAFVLFLLFVGSGAVAPRYLLPLLPLLGYLLLRGVWATATWAKARGRRAPAPGGVGAAAADRGARAALAVAVAVCLAVSLPKVAREVYWMRHPRFYEVYQKGRWQQWVEVSAYLRARGRPGDVVGTAETSVVHYLSGLRFWSEMFPVRPGDPDTVQYGFADLAGFPPRVFAEKVAKTDIRFLAIPTDLALPSGEGSWSDLAMEAIAEVGAFDSPPRRFGNVAVYERAGPRPAAP